MGLIENVVYLKWNILVADREAGGWYNVVCLIAASQRIISQVIAYPPAAVQV